MHPLHPLQYAACCCQKPRLRDPAAIEGWPTLSDAAMPGCFIPTTFAIKYSSPATSSSSSSSSSLVSVSLLSGLPAVTAVPPGVYCTAGGALAGRTSCRRRCSSVMVKIAWLLLDLQHNTNKPPHQQVQQVQVSTHWCKGYSHPLSSRCRVGLTLLASDTPAVLQLPYSCAGSPIAEQVCYLQPKPPHLLFMFVLATARIKVPCMSTLLMSSLEVTCRSQAPAKLTPLGSSRMVTTGRGAAGFAQSRSLTSS